jgi:hypothetical protein
MIPKPRRSIRLASLAMALTCCAYSVERATAQIVAPSTYTTAIQVQGEPAGMEYADWDAAGIPVIVMDPADNPGDLDVANVQIANDDEFIYVRATTHNTEPTSLLNYFLAFDTDQTTTTGFDIHTIGVIGSEFGYQNDYPFAQYAGVYNLNLSITGGPIGNGGALTYPYWTEAGPPQGTQMEWAIALETMVQYPPALGGPAPAFPNPSFNFAVWTDQGIADITEVISYTLATAPSQPGDFDGDDDVDGADFIEWQQELGNGLDADDLMDWRTNFGTAPGLAASRAIPEPATLASAAAGLAGIGAVRRRALRALVFD